MALAPDAAGKGARQRHRQHQDREPAGLAERFGPDIRQFGSFVVTSAIFGLMHPDRWLAGILCGLAYQWLVIRKNRLGDAMTAHALTNLLLGLWVIWKGAWSFW